MKRVTLAFAGLVLAFLATSSLQAQSLPEGVTAEMVTEGQQVYAGAVASSEAIEDIVIHRPTEDAWII